LEAPREDGSWFRSELGFAVKTINNPSLQQKVKTKNMTTLSINNSISRSPLRRTFLLILLVLACFALAPAPNAFGVSPAPDGGYSGGNTAEGQSALFGLTSGGYNTAVGFFSLRSNITNSFNTAIGAGTLLANAADENTAIGAGALLSNSTGSQNTADGAFALVSNTTGTFCTATGEGALSSNTTGNDNTATGFQALFNNTTANDNTANGFDALFNNTSGVNNTAIGSGALVFNTIGIDNTANGFEALFANATGDSNTAIGDSALASNTTGDGNTAIGDSALQNNIAGSNNVALGVTAGVGVITADSVICIGTDGANVSSSCFIGNIRGVTTANGDAIPVLIDSAGQLGTLSSSRRFKKEIKPMDKTSEAILALKPVTFRYKQEIDSKGTPQFGLIAEEVAKVNPDLVVRDRKGEIYSVRYEAVNAMLLNEFLKEHRNVEQQAAEIQEQKATIAELKSNAARREATAARQQKQIAVLTAGLQKVSAQLAAASPSRGGLEASKFATGRTRRGGPAPQVVNNP
jgi:uncharacterized coiled-coil protein SlyX